MYKSMVEGQTLKHYLKAPEQNKKKLKNVRQMLDMKLFFPFFS